MEVDNVMGGGGMMYPYGNINDYNRRARGGGVRANRY